MTTAIRFYNNKYLLLFCFLQIFLTFSTVSVIAQITTTTYLYKSIQEIPDSVIEKRLVELASQGPAFEIAKHQNKLTEYQLKKAKDAWLNLFTFSLNYNDLTFADQTQNVLVYPKYFVGITVPLGMILSRAEVKGAKEQVQIGLALNEQLKRDIKADILSKYRQYKIQNEIIFIQSQITDDAQANFLQTEKKFKDNTASIETYRAAAKIYNEELQKKLNMQIVKENLQLEIEKLIGIPLISVYNELMTRQTAPITK